MTELRRIVDELFDAVTDGDLERMLHALEALDRWRENDARRLRRRRRLGRRG